MADASGSLPGSRIVSELADLATKSAQVYPTLLQAGVQYWAGWAEMSLAYCGTVAQQWSRAVQEPERRAEHVQKMLDGYRDQLVEFAQLSGQLVLKSNEKVEALLRGPKPDAAQSAPSEHALGERVVDTLGRLEPKLRGAGSRAKAGQAPRDQISEALGTLRTAEDRLLEARRHVHAAVEGALREARELQSEEAKAEETPARSLRGLVADLEQIQTLLAPKGKPAA